MRIGSYILFLACDSEFVKKIFKTMTKTEAL